MNDRELIEKEGGAYRLAKRLNYQPQRVQNWVKRGIPSKEKLRHPFLNIADTTNSPNSPQTKTPAAT